MKKIIFTLIIAVFYLAGISQSSDVEKIASSNLTTQNTFAELKVYPNPCKQEKVTVESSNNNISEISITNIAGKQIYFKEFILPEHKIQVELSELPNGIYLVKIKTSDEKQVVKKLIVSKE